MIDTKEVLPISFVPFSSFAIKGQTAKWSGNINFETGPYQGLKIALVPGDGIGLEVVPEGVRILESLSQQYGFEIKFY